MFSSTHAKKAGSLRAVRASANPAGVRRRT